MYELQKRDRGGTATGQHFTIILSRGHKRDGTGHTLYSVSRCPDVCPGGMYQRGKAMRPNINFKGNVAEGDEWRPLGSLGVHYETEWFMASKPYAGGQTVKIFAPEGAWKKANYWLPRDGGKFKGGHDLENIIKHRPALYEAALEIAGAFL